MAEQKRKFSADEARVSISENSLEDRIQGRASGMTGVLEQQVTVTGPTLLLTFLFPNGRELACRREGSGLKPALEYSTTDHTRGQRGHMPPADRWSMDGFDRSLALSKAANA